MNPAQGNDGACGEPMERVYTRGGRARGRGLVEIAGNSAVFTPKLMETPCDVHFEAGTIRQFSRDEAGRIDDISLMEVSMAEFGYSSGDSMLVEGADLAYLPSVSERAGNVGTSSNPIDSGSSGSEASFRRNSELHETTSEFHRETLETTVDLEPEPKCFLMNDGTGGFRLFEYQVDFEPIEDDAVLKKMLLRQHEAALGAYIFDGSILRKTQIIPTRFTTLISKFGEGAKEVQFKVALRFVKEIAPYDNNHRRFFHLVLRKTNEMLGLEEMGQNFFYPSAAMECKDHKLILWRGIHTAIRSHEGGTSLCVEVKHKVVTATTVYELVLSTERTARNKMELENKIKSLIVDSFVIAHYNKKTYKILDVDFKVTPASYFRCHDGTTKSYADFYESRYGIKIPEHEMDQPMLVSVPRKKDLDKGVSGNIYICSSLCSLTELTDDMRKNFSLMKSLSRHLHVGPKERFLAMQHYTDRVLGNPQVRKEFENWGIKLSSTTAVPREKLNFRRIVPGTLMPTPVYISRWIVFTPPEVKIQTVNFIRVMKSIGYELGTHMDDPLDIINYDVQRVIKDTVFNSLRKYLETKTKLDLVFFILPDNENLRYMEVKYCFTQLIGVPSQCCVVDTLSHSDLDFIAREIIRKIMLKLGGLP